MRQLKKLLFLFIIFGLVSLSFASNTVNYKFKLEYKIPFGTTAVTLSEGSIMTGEKLVMPAVQLDGNLAVLNPYLDAIENSYFMFDENAINEDIWLEITLKGIDLSSGLPAPISGQSLFINFDIKVKLSADGSPLLEHYYFNNGTFMYFCIYKTEAFQSILNSLELDGASLAFAYVVDDTFESNAIYFSNTTDSLYFWAEHLSQFAGGSSSITAITDPSQSTLTPGPMDLHQNYPNPFNPSTVIRYELAVNGYVTLNVFGVTGEKVATLVSAEQSAGSHQVTFDARNLANGIYFYKLTSGAESRIRRMVLMK